MELTQNALTGINTLLDSITDDNLNKSEIRATIFAIKKVLYND